MSCAHMLDYDAPLSPFIVAIREMASVPIESMKTGGLLWFTDLTVPDPYYVLPLLSCLSFMATIEVSGGFAPWL